MTSEVSKVWGRQEVKKKDGSIVKLVFQDLPLARFEEAMAFTMKYMLRDEACHKASVVVTHRRVTLAFQLSLASNGIGPLAFKLSGLEQNALTEKIYKNEEALQEYQMLMATIYGNSPPHVMICCVDDGSQDGGELAGMSTVMLLKKNESLYDFIKQFPVKTKEMQRLFSTAHMMDEAINLSKQFESHYYGTGVVVHPDYRGLGIANELIRIRRLICEENNVPMTSAWMTAIGTQKASEKNNWKVDAELDPEKISIQCGVTFENPAKVFKYMYTTKD